MGSIDELVEFFETHDMGDYLEGMQEVEAEVSLEARRRLVALDDDLVDAIEALARQRNVR